MTSYTVKRIDQLDAAATLADADKHIVGQGNVLKRDTNDSLADYVQSRPFTGHIRRSVADSLTAFAGGGQASATAVTKDINRFITVATTADSAKLPVSVAGMEVTLINSGANSMQVFGAGTDTINGVATATGVAQAAGKTAIYSCPIAGQWFQHLSA